MVFVQDIPPQNQQGRQTIIAPWPTDASVIRLRMDCANLPESGLTPFQGFQRPFNSTALTLTPIIAVYYADSPDREDHQTNPIVGSPSGSWGKGGLPIVSIRPSTQRGTPTQVEVGYDTNGSNITFGVSHELA